MTINKELIKSKTIMFIFIIAFVIIFKSLFGEENTLIGVTTITATLMLLDRDFTLSPVKNTFKFLCVNLVIGIGATLASSNIFLGLIFNFLILFFIGYIFCYNLRSPMYLAFTLQYMFILAYPLPPEKLPMRFLSLIVGALIIMASQLVVNKNKLSKSGNKILSNICDLIKEKISHKGEVSNDLEINQHMHDLIDKFRMMIYDKREYNYFLTNEGRLKLNLSVSLESINTLLDKSNIDLIDRDILITLEKLISEVNLVLNNNSSYSPEYIEELLKKCEEKNINDLLNLQLLNSILMLSDTLGSLQKLDAKGLNMVEKTHEFTDIIEDHSLKSFLFDRKSLKFCYAMRIGITIAIGAFITDYFHLVNGRWMIFTIGSLITPLYELSKTKTKDRIFATIVGTLIVFTLFTIFKDTTIRTIIILLAGYIDSYINAYRYSTIFVTISAIGSAAIVGSVEVLSFHRILYVFIGALLALFANKYIFPFKLEDSLNQLNNIYNNTVSKMLDEVIHLVEGNKKPITMKNLVILTSLIDSKARYNEQIANNSCYSEIITERRNLVANIYELYLFILREKVSPYKKQYIISELKNLFAYCDNDADKISSRLEKYIEETKDIHNKIIFSSLAVILKELNHLSMLKKIA